MSEYVRKDGITDIENTSQEQSLTVREEARIRPLAEAQRLLLAGSNP